MKIKILVLLVLFLVSTILRGETLTVGLYKDGLPPLYFAEGDIRTGIYRDIISEVAKITGDKFIFQYSSKQRIVTSFGAGFDLEPGISPIWRPEQSDISIYSEPLYLHREIIFGKADSNVVISGPNDLKGRRVGLIWGYLYPGWMPRDIDYTPIYNNREGKLFEMFAKDRFELGISGEYIAKYHAKQFAVDIAIIHVMYSTQVSFRIHISKKHVIERIDNAIRGLHETGKIQEIIEKYTE